MAIEIPSTPDLPVVWWLFWLVAMAIVFALLAWWLTRAALREDAAPPADHGDREPQGSPPGPDEDVPGR